MRRLVPLVLLLACSDGSGPSREVPETREYAYTFTSDGPGSPSFTGTATITEADAEGVEVTFDVPGHRPEHDLGGWNAGAYVVWARRVAAPFGIPVHRLRVEDGAVVCEGSWRVSGSDYPATCHWD